MNYPLVSAIITSYKRPLEIVSKAIESVMNQSYENVEILLIDDNEDNSKESNQLREFTSTQYPDVNYIKQNGNQGACAARNLGIRCSRGGYIAFLDDDDEWLPDKIKLQVEYFANGAKELALVYGKGVVRDYRYEVVKETPYFNENAIYEDLDFSVLLNGDCIGSTSMPMIKKSVLESLGGFVEELPARQDYEMWLRIAEKYSVTGIDEFLFYHNIHKGEQISKNPKKSYAGFRYIYKEFHDYYLRDLKAHRSIYYKLYHSAVDARIKGISAIKAKYYIIALQDEIRKRI